MISIDTVYQRVLALANKEQRGYITPLEFNLLANQAQQLIFEQYFYDLDEAKKLDTDTTSVSDMVELIESKLATFTSLAQVNNGTQYPTEINDVVTGNPIPVYRTGRIFVLVGGNVIGSASNYEAKLVDVNESRNYLDSRFHRAGLRKNPIYVRSNSAGGDIEVYNHNGVLDQDVTCEVIVRPVKAEWGYDVINERALYNASRSTLFELHESEETELVQKILVLAGITINKPDLAQTAVQLETLKIQQEKQ
jgi:hypothetical protein|tara:strand:- start:5952 stop:6704 length:753 start_codon:yes stop_codon:yes gene_type:complete